MDIDFKKCSKCGLDKELNEFYSYSNKCKKCYKDYSKNYYLNNLEKAKFSQKNWREENRDKIKINSANYRINNLDKVKTAQKNWYKKNFEKVINCSKQYRINYPYKVKLVLKQSKEKNKEKAKIANKLYCKNNRKKLNEYAVNRRKEYPILQLSHNVRGRIRLFLKTKNLTKHNNKTFEIIGCTPQELKLYIESKFTKNMSWENYGYYGWHIDHKIPLDYGKTEDEIYKLCHHTNLQPMWWNENLTKNNKLI